MQEDTACVLCGDSTELIKGIATESVYLILSDIPYGINYADWDVLHSNTNTALLQPNRNEQQADGVFKTRGKPLNGWSKADKNIGVEYYEWCRGWAADWYRVLKTGASCFIFAGRRMAHRCITALEDSGFIFKDMLAWEKAAAMYKAQRVSCVFDRRNDKENRDKWQGWRLGNLRPLFEPILWFMKPYRIGGTLTDNLIENEVGAYNANILTQNIIKVKVEQTDTGLHPTQKPLSLMETLILLTTCVGQTVLDPFCGSGTTLVAAKNLGRKYIGIEISAEYCNVAQSRLQQI